MSDFVYEYTTPYGAKLRIRPLAGDAFIRFTVADRPNNALIDIPLSESRHLCDVLNAIFSDPPRRAYRDSRGVVWTHDQRDGDYMFLSEDGYRMSLGDVDFDYGPLTLTEEG